LLPWLAVAYGFGIVLYFTADHEPAWWAATALAVAVATAAALLRWHLAAFVVALFACAVAAGFAAATVKTALIAHPVLHYPASGVTVTGFVELREESQHTDRTIDAHVRAVLPGDTGAPSRRCCSTASAT
jgi:competence protein ComEC